MAKTIAAWKALTIIGLSLVFTGSALAAEKATCKRCGVGDYGVTVICDGAVKDARVSINCTGGGLFSSQKCYEWRGELSTGDNRIPLNRFTTEEGKRFNPSEFAVRTLRVSSGSDFNEFSYFDFTK